MNWIIENITKEPSFLELANAARELGYPVQEIRGDFKFEDVSGYVNQKVVFNGSIQMVKLVYPILNRVGANNSVYIFCTWENYLCSRYLSHFSGLLFNDHYVMVPLIELDERKFWFYGHFGKEASIFVRPNDGDKSFKGGLLDLQDFDRFYDQFEENKHDLIVVSTPKTIRGEWRFVVHQSGDIIAQSCYRYQGLATRIPSAPPGATEMCREVLSRGYHPDLVYCIDICEDGDGNYWLIELNSFSSAGLYACDKKAIVRYISNL